MSSVFEIIAKHIKENPNSFFVFPSEIAASLWARKICLHGDIRSLSPERFLAWDRFKEETISVKKKNRKPASSLVRRLFALSLARRNAAAPFLTSLVPSEYAANSTVFADFVAALLSSLGRWEELHNAGGFKDDDEDRDLRIIKSIYAVFLRDHDLFEPSWEKTAFQDNGNRYVVFFPGVIADFAEYKAFLVPPSVKIVTDIECAVEKSPLLFFDSARAEIRNAALELRRLHEAGVPYEDAAMTLSDYANLAPYVERELSLRDIPFTRRSGKSLGKYASGRLFALVAECSASLFSFDSVKRLLLDPGIPWKDPKQNRALIDYGIGNHCVSPFKDRGRMADAWEEGFKQNPDENLREYYRKLKQSVLGMAGAKSFRAILEQYHIFRSLLDMEKCGAENDAVLARCVEELFVLIEAEESYSDIAAAAPFTFYVSHLNEKNYVYAENSGGVNLYDYPVAAGAPYRCHILLNASQASAAVEHRPLPFLRQDKRARLGLADVDVSSAMLSLYSVAPWKDFSCHTMISASEKTFSGWAIPHSAFAQNQTRAASPGADDLFSAEQQWRGGAVEKPPLLHAIQKEGFARWNTMLLEPASGKAAAVYSGEAAKQLAQKIRGKNLEPAAGETAELSVSASDLNDFFSCPVLWLYKRIFHLKKQELDASLLDAESLGLIYHKIFQRLFERIKKTDKVFTGTHLDTYSAWTEELSVDVLKSSGALRGALVYPLYASLGRAMSGKVRSILKTEARYFDGFAVTELEQDCEFRQGRLVINGRIDRVSEDPDEGAMIVDYKSGSVPHQSHCRWNEEDGLRDFQIPMYIKLCEEAIGKKINRALFAGISKNEFISIVGNFKGKDFSRETYQDTMDALERAIDEFEGAALSLSFMRKNTPYKTCSSCAYRTMCRSQYMLNPTSDRCAWGAGEEDDEY